MKQRTTVLWRICLIFFALVIPWSVLSFCLLKSAYNKIDEATERMVVQSRQNVLEDFETQLVNTYTTALLSDTLERATYLSTLRDYLTDYERAQAAEQIFESLTLLNTMGEFVDGARVYMQPLHTIYNNEGSLSGCVQPLSDGEFKRIAEMASSTISLPVDGNRILLLLKNAKTNPSCIMEVELSHYALHHYLKNALEFTDESQFSLEFQDSGVILRNTADTALLSAAQKAADVNNSLAEFSYGHTVYYVYSYYSNVFNFTYYELFPKYLLLKPVQLSSVLTMAFALLSVIVMILFFAESVKLIHRPLQNLANSFAALRKGDFTVRAESPETADFVYLYDSFNHMARELETLVFQNYHQKILLQKAELRQLQAQINPHFLYNSFFLLQRVISSGDTEQAEQIARELGIYFRYITKQNSDTVLLENEVEHAKIYADIQSIRFSQRIDVEFGSLPQQYADLQVPKLFLQPLIENAFKYGLENKISGGILRVTYQVAKSGNLVICVEDNGEELSDDHLDALIQQIQVAEAQGSADELSGIMNIARRLRIFYQSADCIILDRSPLGGMRVTIQLGQN